MQVKALFLLTVFFGVTFAQRRLLLPSQPPPAMTLLPNIPSGCLQTQYGYAYPCYDGSTLPSKNCEKCGRNLICYEGLQPMVDFCDRPMCCQDSRSAVLYQYDKSLCYDGSMLPTVCCGNNILTYDGSMLPANLGCGCDQPYEDLILPSFLDCGYKKPPCCNKPMLSTQKCGCVNVKPRCNENLVLPPLRVELPQNLGYFPSAVPLVSSYFNPAIDACVCAGASVPVTSPCSCLTLAAPVCPDIAPLVRPIIL